MTTDNLSHARIISVGGHTPQVDPGAFIAAGATLVGDVRVLKGASVFYGCVLRAEAAPITIGEDSNVQDNTVMHTDEGKPVVIGARVSIGHQALIHGAIVDDDVLIGMHATVLNDAHVGTESLVAAGAIVLEGTEIPPRSLVAGVPAKVRREMTDDGVEKVRQNAQSYLRLSALHRDTAEVLDEL
ncbi:gamma carbonic anhydrase family protein [Brevibacterium aurantiacum]|uniref:Carbonic anhydrase or acetyltransferase, isoleucine patch superfamily n=1 Tax=Brevibacterium aurantiacum TaxID=273384 RepID=A0A2H1J6N1_BREAU|nr:gamma carbonic anhydrase family protein [Brevibacterium aurantiacum]MDN6371821.1 gamma carbonic anhydrase family protein [Brevibacterium aurantiacum]RCS90653.1 gamma carbonic anhydrase family protein [Brevibacterium aurantiacum]TGD39486.1 gamma carbonic anhydrase family protein [Brevibacterium aurantiacum]SMX83089.1 Carbonic anhydrase or acetyltransferase, isoleucine patch superfamily [Brevibacterium aurantiacum]